MTEHVVYSRNWLPKAYTSEWQKKCLDKLERTATVEIQISSEDVIVATKEPRVSFAGGLASFGEQTTFPSQQFLVISVQIFS